MTLGWKLADFLTGELSRTESIPVASDRISIDILGAGDADLIVERQNLLYNDSNNWRSTFAPLLRCMILDDDSKAWNHHGAVRFAGLINKIAPPIGGSIQIQLVELNEYLKMRLVADSWSEITNPTEAVVWTGNTYRDLMIKAVKQCFSQSGIPSGAPRPPESLGTVPTPSEGSLTKTVLKTDMKTYHDLLTELKADSGIGLEWMFVPRWASSARNKIVWDLLVGTTTSPHLREGGNVTLNLDETNETRFSGYDLVIDSRETASKLWIQSLAGDVTTATGADLISAYDATFHLLVEKFFAPGVELTTAERNQQLTERMVGLKNPGYAVSFSIEEYEDPTEWINNIGATVTTYGIPDTISADMDAILRCTGVTFSSGNGTIEVDVQQPMINITALPKQKVGGSDSGNSPSLNDSGGSDTGGGGGTDPTDPVDPVDPDLDPGEGWEYGSGGVDPLNPVTEGNPDYAIIEAKLIDMSELASQYIFSQTQGNEIYGMKFYYGIISGRNTYSYNTVLYEPQWSAIPFEHTIELIKFTLDEGTINNKQLTGAYTSSRMIEDLYNQLDWDPPFSTENGRWSLKEFRYTIGWLNALSNVIYYPVHMTTIWQNPTTGQLYTITGTAFLKRLVKANGTIGPLAVDSGSYDQTLETGPDINNPANIYRGAADELSINPMMNVGSWVISSTQGTTSGLSTAALANGSIVRSANIKSGGNNMSTWWNWNCPEDELSTALIGAPSQRATIAKSPDGAGLAYYTISYDADGRVFISYILLEAFPVPKNEAEGGWVTIDMQEFADKRILGLFTLNGSPFFVTSEGPDSGTGPITIFQLMPNPKELVFDLNALGISANSNSFPAITNLGRVFTYGKWAYFLGKQSSIAPHAFSLKIEAIN